MDPAKPQNIARERWLILRNALLNKRLLDASSCSVTRHNTTALFSIEKLRALKTTSLEEDDWLEYRMSIDAKIDREAVTLLVKQPRAFISKQVFRFWTLPSVSRELRGVGSIFFTHEVSISSNFLFDFHAVVREC